MSAALVAPAQAGHGFGHGHGYGHGHGWGLGHDLVGAVVGLATLPLAIASAAILGAEPLGPYEPSYGYESPRIYAPPAYYAAPPAYYAPAPAHYARPPAYYPSARAYYAPRYAPRGGYYGGHSYGAGGYTNYPRR